jgi:hypothetical protein
LVTLATNWELFKHDGLGNMKMNLNMNMMKRGMVATTPPMERLDCRPFPSRLRAVCVYAVVKNV